MPEEGSIEASRYAQMPAASSGHTTATAFLPQKRSFALMDTWNPWTFNSTAVWSSGTGGTNFNVHSGAATKKVEVPAQSSFSSASTLFRNIFRLSTNQIDSSFDSSHQCNAPVVLLPHVTAVSSEDDEPNSEEDSKSIGSSVSGSHQFHISSHIASVSTDIDELWNEFSKSHADFEVPPFLVEVLQQKGFHLGHTIGWGTYGKVYLATYTSNGGACDSWKPWTKKNRSFAIKVMEKKRLSKQYRSKFLLRELRALLTLKAHPNIVQVYDVFTVSELINNNPQSKIITMIMEHCPNGDMFEYVTKRRHLPERLAQRWFVQLLSGLDHLHRLGMAHRDIKCENLLLDGNFNLKICDFGFCLDLKTIICDQCTSGSAGRGSRPPPSFTSYPFSSSSSFQGLEKRSQTFCGSQCYCSPELLRAEAYNAQLNDVWSSGVILFIWLYNVFPISGDQLKRMHTFEYSMIRIPLQPHISANCYQVLKSIFQPEGRRCSVAQLRQMPWIVRYKETPGWESALLHKEDLARLFNRTSEQPLKARRDF